MSLLIWQTWKSKSSQKPKLVLNSIYVSWYKHILNFIEFLPFFLMIQANSKLRAIIRQALRKKIQCHNIETSAPTGKINTHGDDKIQQVRKFKYLWSVLATYKNDISKDVFQKLRKIWRQGKIYLVTKNSSDLLRGLILWQWISDNLIRLAKTIQMTNTENTIDGTRK